MGEGGDRIRLTTLCDISALSSQLSAFSFQLSAFEFVLARLPRMQKLTCACVLSLLFAQQPAPSGRATVIRAGRLIDPATGTAAASQTIVVENGRIAAIGSNLPAPAGAEIIDLSNLTVLPGLVDAHNHLALTYK